MCAAFSSGTAFVPSAAVAAAHPTLRPAFCHKRVFRSRTSPHRRRVRRNPTFELESPSPAANGAVTSSDSRPGPSLPDAQPPLPPSSQVALYSSFALALAGLAVPLGLSVHDAAVAHDAMTAHLADYASHFTMLLLTLGFGVMHSGLASLRPRVAAVIGERAYRVLFALASIPSAVGVISYFIAHRYDGAVLLAGVRGLPWLHDAVWGATFVSFLFLYPATFNLLEVAAVQRPGFRIYERGITRVTRHPQLFGQLLWCVAHTAWLDSSFALVASLGLVAHHAFGAWNGDRRLRDRFGGEWVEYAGRTSIVPFATILDGKQTLRIGEFLRPSYVGVVLATLGFYAAHPAVLRAVSSLGL